MRTTVRKIAEEAGVSPSTVSRVLSGRGAHLISPATRERILAIAEQLEYTPNTAARSLVTGRTGLVALWMAQIYTRFHARVIQLVEETLVYHGYDVLIRHIGFAHTQHRWNIGSVDGILAYECSLYVDSIWKRLHRRMVPVVSMGAYYNKNVDHVGVDLHTAGVQAVRHLSDVGCRRIAYLVNAESNVAGDARRDAYDTVAQERGLLREYIVAADQSRSASSDAVQQYLREYGTPDGIFCHNDEMAIGAYHGLRQLGVHVPDEVALVGCDGIEDTEYLDVPLSTICQPLEEMCQVGWEMLCQRMSNPEREVHSVILQPRLLVRASSMR